MQKIEAKDVLIRGNLRHYTPRIYSSGFVNKLIEGGEGKKSRRSPRGPTANTEKMAYFIMPRFG